MQFGQTAWASRSAIALASTTLTIVLSAVPVSAQVEPRSLNGSGPPMSEAATRQTGSPLSAEPAAPPVADPASQGSSSRAGRDSAAVPSNTPQESTSGIGDIIVTAERRSTNVQTTPIAISAVDSSYLRSSGINNVESLAQHIPNLTFSRLAGDAKIFIRGIGFDSVAPGGETRVALYLDGAYQSRSQAAFAGFYDIERVEVLRGPQGTLYGRNAVAGTINVLTRNPTSEFEGYLTGSVGNYGLVGLEGAAGGPISSTLEGRIAFRSADREGYGRNLQSGEDVNDEHSRSARAKLKYAPTSAIRINFIGDYTRERDHNGSYRYIGQANPAIIPTGQAIGGTVPSNPQDAVGFGPRLRRETYGFSAQGDLDLTGTTTLTSLAAYRHLEDDVRGNVDGTTAGVTRQYLFERSNTVSEELRVSQKLGSFGDLIIGGYYFHERNFAANRVPFLASLFGQPFDYVRGFGTNGTGTTNALAAFGQANLHLTDRLELDFGARYSHEKKTADVSVQQDVVSQFDPNGPIVPLASLRQSDTWSSFDPKATLSYKAADGIFVYATYSRGFKAGGFNLGGLQPPFRPEKLTNYEAGIKADLFDRRLRANVSAFYYDYKDLQVNIVEGFALVTRNAATARIKGVEAEITALPTEKLRITLTGAYLDAKYRRFVAINPSDPLADPDLSGNRLNYAPRYKVDAEIGYTIDTSLGVFTPRANVTWTDRIYFDQFNLRVASQPARTEVNLYLNWKLPDSGWSLAAYLKNLTDKTYVIGAVVSTCLIGCPVVGQYGPPRTFGLSLTKDL